MPAERTIHCTHCGAERTTRAGRNTALRCRGCGRQFRAPEPPAPDPVADAGDRSTSTPSAGEARPEDAGGGSGAEGSGASRTRDAGGPRVNRASSTTVAGAPTSGEGGDPGSAPSEPTSEGDRPAARTAPEPQDGPRKPDPDDDDGEGRRRQRRAKRLGRAGGVGYYARRVKGATGGR